MPSGNTPIKADRAQAAGQWRCQTVPRLKTGKSTLRLFRDSFVDKEIKDAYDLHVQESDARFGLAGLGANNEEKLRVDLVSGRRQ